MLGEGHVVQNRHDAAQEDSIDVMLNLERERTIGRGETVHNTDSAWNSGYFDDTCILPRRLLVVETWQTHPSYQDVRSIRHSDDLYTRRMPQRRTAGCGLER